jgi:hypothetical protein
VRGFFVYSHAPLVRLSKHFLFMSIADFRKQIAAAATLGQLNGLLNASFGEFAVWSKAEREGAMDEWAARRNALLTAQDGFQFPSGFRVPAGGAGGSLVPDGPQSCQRAPSERAAGRVSPLPAIQFPTHPICYQS